MVRKLTAALLGVGVMVPGLANALGLGEIKLNSHLSEPLDAEIELVQTRELTESEILPGLASPDDFDSAGVERFHHLTDMKFEVIVNNNGRSYIKVKSRKPIREPFVNFLVEVHWPAGRLLREYTLLLDPPNFSLAAPQPVQPAVTTTSAPTTTTVTSAPAPAPTPKPAVTAPASTQSAASEPAPAGGKTYGPTKSSDSLWSIARALRPSNDISIQQTMIAIQQLNPDAFINGNINLLKKGKILRGPSVEEARQFSSRDAINQVNQQNRAWKDRVASKSTAAETETAQIDTSGRAVDSFEEAVRSDEGRLRLVSADSDASSSSTGQGGTSDNPAGGALRERAELAEEAADQYRLENDDLKSKVNELEEQVGTGEKLLDLKDDQIAALQARLAKMEAELQQAKTQAQSGDLAPAEPMVAEAVTPDPMVEPEVVEEAAPVVEDEAAADQVADQVDYNFQEESALAEEADAQETAVQEPLQAVQVEEAPTEVVASNEEQQAPVEPKKELSFMEQVLSNPLYMAIAGGSVAVLAVLGLVLGRRRKESDDELDEALVEDFSLDIEEDPVDMAEESFEEAAEEAGGETVAETADVLGEADIYIAYGRFPQAIEMLEKAADAEPQRGDIRIKLLETSVEAQDQDTFMKHYEGVQELGVPSDIEKANALKEQFIGNADMSGDFNEDAGDDTLVMGTDLGDSNEEVADFNFDADADETVIQPADEPAAEVEEQTDDFNLDFDIDSDTNDLAAEPADEVAADTAEDTSLDFDLDLDADIAEAPAGEVVEDVSNDATAEAESLDFDAEFSLDLDEGTDTEAPSEVSFDEAEESLDFELAEDTVADAEPATEESLEFDLDLDSVGDDIEASVDDGDETILAMPQEDGAGSQDDVIGSMEAAKLADELDLDGDFDLNLDEATEEVAATDEPEFSVDIDDGAADEVAAPEAIVEESAPEAEPESFEPPVEAVAAAAVAAAVPAAAAANSEEELDFLSDADEASTKLDLARAYIDMGDREGAKDILDEVLIEGNEEQQGDAKELLARLD